MMNVAARVIALGVSLYHCRVEGKRGRITRVRYWEIIARNLKKRGCSLSQAAAAAGNPTHCRTKASFQNSRKRKAKILIALAALGFALCGSVQAQLQIIDDNGHVTALPTEANEDFDHPPRIITSTWPDGHWILCYQHFGSHAGFNRLYRSQDGLKFEPVLEDFDMEAWKFFRKVEGVSRKDTEFVNEAEFVSWTPDGKLLFSLESRLGLSEKEILRPSKMTTPGYTPRSDPAKPGVADWRAYFNLKTQRFELTDELRATNKEARKRWSEGKQLEPTDTRIDEEAHRQKH
jgi:hypothetical protein